ncbi:MAG: OmpA family protein [Nitrospirae bacterium]|nr:OmpA family protein [Nitrospirota bacterium]
MPKYLLVSLVIMTVLMGGCASLANTDSVSVLVYTNPPGANLFVAGRAYRSPDVVKVPRGQGDFDLIIEKPGFKPGKVVLKESMDAWLWYNIFNLGLGLVHDFKTKRAYDLEPEVVHFNLVAEEELIAKVSNFQPLPPKLEDSRLGLAGGSPDLDVFFNFNSWAIRKDAEATIKARGKLLKTSHRNSQLLIEGHSDERGADKYNLVLGQKRARAIQYYLVDLGIDPSRIRLISYGKEKPVCLEQNETCYQLNRRGHFEFVRN